MAVDVKAEKKPSVKVCGHCAGQLDETGKGRWTCRACHRVWKIDVKSGGNTVSKETPSSKWNRDQQDGDINIEKGVELGADWK